MTRLRRPLLSLICLALIVLTGCGEKHEKPEALNGPAKLNESERLNGLEELNEWRKLPQANFAIPPYARYLEGIKICLDPGHGGQAHLLNYKRGPTGLREAEVNLHVALYLREFLKEAGAIVFMTRTDDSFVSITDRSKLANKNAVDFFYIPPPQLFQQPRNQLYLHMVSSRCR